MLLEYYHPEKQTTCLGRYGLYENHRDFPEQCNMYISHLKNHNCYITDADIDLWDICVKKVQNLRKHHSYLRVWFSGGFDSRVVLESFKRAKIKPDEIRILDKDLYDKTFPYYHGLEIENSALPYLEKEPFFHDVNTVITSIGEDWINDWYKNNTEFYKKHHHLSILSWCAMHHMVEWTRSVGEKPDDCLEIIGGEWPHLVHDIYYGTNCVLVDKQVEHGIHPDIYDFNLSDLDLLRGIVQKYIFLKKTIEPGWHHLSRFKKQMFPGMDTDFWQMPKNFPNTRFEPKEQLDYYHLSVWQTMFHELAKLKKPEWYKIYQKIAKDPYFKWHYDTPGMVQRLPIIRL